MKTPSGTFWGLMAGMTTWVFTVFAVSFAAGMIIYLASHGDFWRSGINLWVLATMAGAIVGLFPAHSVSQEVERRLFYSLFGTLDQKEGMRAFIEKRPARFEGK